MYGLAVTLLLGLSTILTAAICIPAGILGKPRWIDSFIRIWSQFAIKISSIDLKVTGVENLPSSGILFLFNHTSLLDIPIAHAAIPMGVRFAAKKELFRIPIFAQGMQAAGVLPIDRKNREKAIGVLSEAEKRIKKGENFILAPEGTRQKTPTIGPFKSGPFILAIDAKAVIVPVVLTGATRILGHKKLCLNLSKDIDRRVYVDILPPVSTEGFSFETRNELKNQVRDMMENAFQKRSRES